jgi:toxin ParE1/3/4
MILFSSEALSDIDPVRNFLDARNPDAAARAMRAIWRALECVENFPEMGKPTKDRNIRQILVRFGQRGYVVQFYLPMARSLSRVSGIVASGATDARERLARARSFSDR